MWCSRCCRCAWSGQAPDRAGAHLWLRGQAVPCRRCCRTADPAPCIPPSCAASCIDHADTRCGPDPEMPLGSLPTGPLFFQTLAPHRALIVAILARRPLMLVLGLLLGVCRELLVFAHARVGREVLGDLDLLGRETVPIRRLRSLP